MYAFENVYMSVCVPRCVSVRPRRTSPGQGCPRSRRPSLRPSPEAGGPHSVAPGPRPGPGPSAHSAGRGALALALALPSPFSPFSSSSAMAAAPCCRHGDAGLLGPSPHSPGCRASLPAVLEGRKTCPSPLYGPHCTHRPSRQGSSEPLQPAASKDSISLKNTAFPSNRGDFHVSGL